MDEGFLLPVALKSVFGSTVEKILVLSATHLVLQDLKTEKVTHRLALTSLSAAKQQGTTITITITNTIVKSKLTLLLADAGRADTLRMKLARSAGFVDRQTLAALEERASDLRYDLDAQRAGRALAAREMEEAVKRASVAEATASSLISDLSRARASSAEAEEAAEHKAEAEEAAEALVEALREATARAERAEAEQMAWEGRLGRAKEAGSAILRRARVASRRRRCFRALQAHAAEKRQRTEAERTPPHAPSSAAGAGANSTPVEAIRLPGAATPTVRPSPSPLRRTPSAGKPHAAAHALDFSGASGGRRATTPLKPADKAAVGAAASEYEHELASAQAEALEAQRAEMREVVSLLASQLESIGQLHAVLLGHAPLEPGALQLHATPFELGALGGDATAAADAAAKRLGLGGGLGGGSGGLGGDGFGSRTPSSSSSPTYKPYALASEAASIPRFALAEAESPTGSHAGSPAGSHTGSGGAPPTRARTEKGEEVEEGEEVEGAEGATTEAADEARGDAEELLEHERRVERMHAGDELVEHALAERLAERMALVSALQRRLEKSALLVPASEADEPLTPTPTRPRGSGAAEGRQATTPSRWLGSDALERLQRSQYSKAGFAVCAYQGFDPTGTPAQRSAARRRSVA